jgi:hypothetical protein
MSSGADVRVEQLQAMLRRLRVGRGDLQRRAHHVPGGIDVLAAPRLPQPLHVLELASHHTAEVLGRDQMDRWRQRQAQEGAVAGLLRHRARQAVEAELLVVERAVPGHGIGPGGRDLLADDLLSVGKRRPLVVVQRHATRRRHDAIELRRLGSLQIRRIGGGHPTLGRVVRERPQHADDRGIVRLESGPVHRVRQGAGIARFLVAQHQHRAPDVGPVGADAAGLLRPARVIPQLAVGSPLALLLEQPARFAEVTGHQRGIERRGAGDVSRGIQPGQHPPRRQGVVRAALQQAGGLTRRGRRRGRRRTPCQGRRRSEHPGR